MTRAEFVRAQLERWRELRAWGRSLSTVTVNVSRRACAQRLGTCWPYQQRVVVYHQPRVEDVLKTGLHELAHAATIGDAHDVKWQVTYALAVTEVTGVSVVWGCEDHTVLDEAAQDVMRAWWSRSSERFAYNLLVTESRSSAVGLE